MGKNRDLLDTQVKFVVRESDYFALRRLATQQGISLSEMIRKIVLRKLARDC